MPGAHTVTPHTPTAAAPGSWCTWREAAGILGTGRHLRNTVVLALVVGSVLFAINQLDVVVGGHADAGTVVKIVLTYVVPYVVSNCGVLMATRRTDRETRPERDP